MFRDAAQLARQIDKGVGVDVLSLVQNAVHGERRVVETVANDVRADADGPAFDCMNRIRTQALFYVGE